MKPTNNAAAGHILRPPAHTPADKSVADWPPPVPGPEPDVDKRTAAARRRLSIIALLLTTIVPAGFVTAYVPVCNLRLGPTVSDWLFMVVACGVCFLASLVCGWMARTDKFARVALVLAVGGMLMMIGVLPSLVSSAAADAREQRQIVGGRD